MHCATIKLASVHEVQHDSMRAGGGIFVDSGSQSNITGSNFILNSAGQSGGAVAQADSTSVIADSQFTSNSGSTQGGAMFQNNMTGSVYNCRFFNNSGATGVSCCYPENVLQLSCLRLLIHTKQHTSRMSSWQNINAYGPCSIHAQTCCHDCCFTIFSTQQRLSFL